MKKKFFKQATLIALFVFVLFKVSSSQIETFSKIISTSLDETIKDVVEDSIGNFYYVGHNANPGYAQIKTNGFIMKTDYLGNVLDSVTHSSSNESIEYYHIFMDGTNHLDISGYSASDYNWPHRDSKFFLKKLTTSLSIVKSKSYFLPGNYGLQHVKTRRGINRDFLFVSYVWYASNFMWNPVFLRTNSNFDSLAFKIMLDIGHIGEDIKQLDTNNYWFVSAGGRILLMDSLFVPTGQFSKIPHDLSSSYGINWDTDTSFYLVGEWDDGPDDDIGFVKQHHTLDTNDNIFNTFGALDTLDYPAEYGGLDFNNKDSIYIGGTINWLWDFNEWENNFFILQTDSLLNIRWERFYGGDAYYVMTKIKATHDGGCIAIGDRYDYQNTDEEERDIYILKLNNEGLITGNPEMPKVEMREALVFPNPGTDFLRVRIAAQYPKSTFELFDMNGNLVLKERIEGKWKQISTSFLAQGTYIYKIHNQEGLFESGKWVKN